VKFQKFILMTKLNISYTEEEKLSSDFQEKRAKLLGEFAHELRQFNGLGASFFRAAAARIGMTDTDMQVIDILDSTGPATAGQLADLTGLTTGAITGMLNRLEEAGLVRRERDPNDGRKVIVRLEKGKDEMREINAMFDGVGGAWDDMASSYDNEQLAFLLEFLRRSNAISRKEIFRLREAPESERGIFSAPLADLESARLVFPAGAFRLSLHASDIKGALYQARFQGRVPEVKAKDGVVTIRYPRRLWVPSKDKTAAEVTLSAAIPWQIVIQGGASEITAELGKLNLASLEVKGGLHKVHLDLPAPSGVVPMRISGGVSEVTVRRPAGVAARVHLKGWAAEFVFDDQTFSAVGNDVQLQSQGFDPAAPYYDIEVPSSASQLAITSGLDIS
jgi:DNA-binding MarR family transcriptional regulator